MDNNNSNITFNITNQSQIDKSNNTMNNFKNTQTSPNSNSNKEIKAFKKTIIGIVILLATLIFIPSFTFTVSETEQAVVTRFGEVTKIIVDEKTHDIESTVKRTKFKNVKILEGKGLFFKVPFLDNVKKYDNRLLTYDTDPREVITKDKKKLILDNNAQWIIENPLLFHTAMRNEQTAHTRLDDIMFSKMNEKIGQTEAHMLISDKAYTNEMLDTIIKEVNKSVKDYGIKVIDIRIKRTDLPSENSKNIFNRMKTEREQKAKQYRSEGLEEAQKIKSEADKQAKIIEAKAYAEAEKIKGEGDAEATRIYNEAYNKDPEFYEFYKTLQTYKKTLKNNTKIIIDSNSPFAKYLLGK
ncbi:modulator of FtsH protease HflC [Clostridium tepidiprofundi DSM 19306]|uniref:Protein HflC n=1 Tax=Clostridium tepidiprofundi DSM 19306 TaxID=1121338 RepID=A0A151B711_9CLOT|nr:protease modulator HflC [Clostridium tepidiprofundi]KYH35532.1 modulator of FtsH protease HflC [Clostridium tepidiprofundi DSM 19306]